MNEYFIERLNELRRYINTFRDIWDTVLVRAAWFEAEGDPRLLLLSIKLLSGLPSVFNKPAHSPEVGSFRVTWQSLPMTEIDNVLQQLSKGIIQINDVTLKLEYKNLGKWEDIVSSFVTYEWPGSYNPFERPTAHLSLTSTGPMIDEIYTPVRDQEMLEKWRALSAPYWDRNDVLYNFFGIPRKSEQDNIILYIGGLIPISFSPITKLSGNALNVGIEAPTKTKPDKISIGVIANTPLRFTSRFELKSSGNWEHDEQVAEFHRQYTLDDSYTRITLILRYFGIPVERIELLNDPALNKPAVMNLAYEVHRAVDNSLKFYQKGLSGQGSDRGNDLERAVSYLFSFLGFSVLIYGDQNPFRDCAPDIIATSQKHDTVLAIECTTSSPNTQNKLSKLHERCRGLSERLPEKRIIPVIVTALSQNQVPHSEASMAIQDHVAMITTERLWELHEMAVSGTSLDLILNTIERFCSGR